MTKIEIKGTVEKIVRQNGKAEAQMLITILLAQGINVPLGPVAISVQTMQSSIFEKEGVETVGSAKKKK
jgi:hypothetical protein